VGDEQVFRALTLLVAVCEQVELELRQAETTPPEALLRSIVDTKREAVAAASVFARA
jgi:hypothetical protein